MNLCTVCRKDFGSVTAFDHHRAGKHAYLWSVDREDGRRCLATDELEQAGWKRDRHGRWRTPGDNHWKSEA